MSTRKKYELQEENELNVSIALEHAIALTEGVSHLACGCRYNDDLDNKQRDAFLAAATWAIDHLMKVVSKEFKAAIPTKETAPHVTADQSLT